MAPTPTGYYPTMGQILPGSAHPHAYPDRVDAPHRSALRRILIAAGLVIGVLIVIVAAIYAMAFVILAPVMQ